MGRDMRKKKKIMGKKEMICSCDEEARFAGCPNGGPAKDNYQDTDSLSWTWILPAAVLAGPLAFFRKRRV